MIKRGQVTIFIILGILVVAGISTVLILSKPDLPDIFEGLGKKGSPQTALTECINHVLENKTSEIIKNGGRLNPNLYVEYKGQNHTYLCYTDVPYTGCVNYYPLLKKRIEVEIVETSAQEINNCFETMINDYKNQGYVVSEGNLNHTVSLVDDSLYSKIEKRLIFSKGEDKEIFENFNSILPTKASQLIDVAHRIINEEASSCYFDEISFMKTNPEFSIYHTVYGTEQANIYQIKYRGTDEQFNFAVRSCVLL